MKIALLTYPFEPYEKLCISVSCMPFVQFKAFGTWLCNLPTHMANFVTSSDMLVCR